jgi:hypothetical protein
LGTASLSVTLFRGSNRGGFGTAPLSARDSRGQRVKGRCELEGVADFFRRIVCDEIRSLYFACEGVPQEGLERLVRSARQVIEATLEICGGNEGTSIWK